MECADFLEKAARLSSMAKTCDDPLIAQLLKDLAETYLAEAQEAGQSPPSVVDSTAPITGPAY